MRSDSSKSKTKKADKNMKTLIKPKTNERTDTVTETTWPRNKTASVETRKRDLVIRIADWTRDKDAPCYDVEFYHKGVYDWNKSHSFDASMLGHVEAKKRAIAHAQTLIAANL